MGSLWIGFIPVRGLDSRSVRSHSLFYWWGGRYPHRSLVFSKTHMEIWAVSTHSHGVASASSSWMITSVTCCGRTFLCLWNEGTCECSEPCQLLSSSLVPLNPRSQDHPALPLLFECHPPDTHTHAVDTGTRAEVTQTKGIHDAIKSAIQWGQVTKQRVWISCGKRCTRDDWLLWTHLRRISLEENNSCGSSSNSSHWITEWGGTDSFASQLRNSLLNLPPTCRHCL